MIILSLVFSLSANAFNAPSLSDIWNDFSNWAMGRKSQSDLMLKKNAVSGPSAKLLLPENSGIFDWIQRYIAQSRNLNKFNTYPQMVLERMNEIESQGVVLGTQFPVEDHEFIKIVSITNFASRTRNSRLLKNITELSASSHVGTRLSPNIIAEFLAIQKAYSRIKDKLTKISTSSIKYFKNGDEYFVYWTGTVQEKEVWSQVASTLWQRQDSLVKAIDFRVFTAYFDYLKNGGVHTELLVPSFASLMQMDVEKDMDLYAVWNASFSAQMRLISRISKEDPSQILPKQLIEYEIELGELIKLAMRHKQGADWVGKMLGSGDFQEFQKRIPDGLRMRTDIDKTSSVSVSQFQEFEKNKVKGVFQSIVLAIYFDRLYQLREVFLEETLMEDIYKTYNQFLEIHQQIAALIKNDVSSQYSALESFKLQFSKLNQFTSFVKARESQLSSKLEKNEIEAEYFKVWNSIVPVVDNKKQAQSAVQSPLSNPN